MSYKQQIRTVRAKELVEGKVDYLPSPYLLLSDSETANNLAAALNILAAKGYEVVSSSYSESAHFVIMKRAERIDSP
jgi:hypothetical protein